MSDHDICQLCLNYADEWDEPTFEDHLRTHTRASVVDMYDEELATRVFDEESTDVDEATSDASIPEVEDDPNHDTDPEENSSRAEAGPETTTDVTTDLVGGRGKKWYMIGIGGAGNHILDSVLLRRETLARNNDPMASVWEGGLAGYLSLNTNVAELGSTYYAQVDKGYDADAVRQNGIIANKVHDASGAGRQWTVGRDLMEWEFEDERNPIIDRRWPVDEQHLKGAQAIMFIHSVTKGTGCGATPVLARKLREEVLQNDPIIPKPMLSSVVVPQASETGGGEMIRGVVGMALLSQAVEGIIPFDNAHLSEQVGERRDEQIAIGDIETYNPDAYVDINRVIAEFLEAFTMSSTINPDAESVVSGETFDVRDSFAPVLDKYRVDPEREYDPAVVMAPVVGRSRATSFDRSTLELLANSALKQGRLAEFDPSTAWGGTFLIYGPEDAMDEVGPLVNDGVLREVLGSDEFLASDDIEGAASVDIYTDQLVVPHTDSVQLWGLLWNPKLPPLERMYDHAKRRKEEGTARGAQTIQEIWHLIEPLFGSLGRENMG